MADENAHALAATKLTLPFPHTDSEGFPSQPPAGDGDGDGDGSDSSDTEAYMPPGLTPWVSVADWSGSAAAVTAAVDMALPSLSQLDGASTTDVDANYAEGGGVFSMDNLQHPENNDNPVRSETLFSDTSTCVDIHPFSPPLTRACARAHTHMAGLHRLEVWLTIACSAHAASVRPPPGMNTRMPSVR